MRRVARAEGGCGCVDGLVRWWVIGGGLVVFGVWCVGVVRWWVRGEAAWDWGGQMLTGVVCGCFVHGHVM